MMMMLASSHFPLYTNKILYTQTPNKLMKKFPSVFKCSKEASLLKGDYDIFKKENMYLWNKKKGLIWSMHKSNESIQIWSNFP